MTASAATVTRALPVGDRRVPSWLPLALVLLCAAAEWVLLLWPYYAGGIQHHDLDTAPNSSTTWPISDPGLLGTVFVIGGLFTVLAAPLMTIAVGVFTPLHLVAEWPELRPSARAALVAASVVAVALFVLQVTTSVEPRQWWMG